MDRIFTLIPVLMIVFSCSQDRKIQPDEPEEPAVAKLTGLLKAVTVKSDAGETKMEYSYIDSLTLKSIRYTRGGKTTVETFEYEKDTLRTSQIEDTLKKYVYRNGRLQWIEKHLKGKPESYIIVIFSYFSDVKISNIENRLNSTDGLSSKFLGEFSINWREENVRMFRERFTTGLVEDYEFQYGQPRNPFTRLYSETLRVPSENPNHQSYNSPVGYLTFFAGMKYRVEGKYLENRLPLSQTISEFDIEKGGDWKVIKQYTFEYYE